jgi:hypothetical protein
LKVQSISGWTRDDPAQPRRCSNGPPRRHPPVRAEISYTVDYRYDALGWVAQCNGAVISYHDLTNNQVKVPSPSADAVVFRAPDGAPISGKTGSLDAQALVTDLNHGDVTAALNIESGTIGASVSYSPGGESTVSNGDLPLGFQGGWTDPTPDSPMHTPAGTTLDPAASPAASPGTSTSARHPSPTDTSTATLTRSTTPTPTAIPPFRFPFRSASALARGSAVSAQRLLAPPCQCSADSRSSAAQG